MIHCLQDFIQVFPVGIGNKYLPETISTVQLDDLSHSCRIQCIKYIIEELIRSCLSFPGQKSKLSQLQCNQISFILSLRTDPAD